MSVQSPGAFQEAESRVPDGMTTTRICALVAPVEPVAKNGWDRLILQRTGFASALVEAAVDPVLVLNVPQDTLTFQMSRT
jgi:hypothetical protein